MRNVLNGTTGHNPLDSYAKKLFEKHPAHSEFGINIRRGDARLRLQEILRAESTVKQQEKLNRQISDNIARLQAEHELNMHYLIQFGVRADERMQFQQLLEQVAEHGGLSLREAAHLSHAIAQRNQLNGSGDSSVSTTVSSLGAE